jgi:coenzyme F420-0:L-glutamate ligase / coenzyme F420-1:gamma-L-glutamate ligase
MTLIVTPLPGIPSIQPADDLVGIILDALGRANLILESDDVLVLAQKIVSKAEGRLVNLGDVTPSKRALDLADETHKDPRVVELILSESCDIVRTRPGLIVVEHKLGFVCANAGIDRSNVRVGDHEFVLLLPENPDKSAADLRSRIQDATGTQIGVQIIDSHGRAWRLGTVGISIGIAGLPGVVDFRGRPDMFGRRLEVTEIGAADELAAAASLMMGQAGEGIPVVHVRGFPHAMRQGSLAEMIRPKAEDLFR